MQAGAYGLNALQDLIEQCPSRNPSTATLLCLAELVLTTNCFSSGDHFMYFVQIDDLQ